MHLSEADLQIMACFFYGVNRKGKPFDFSAFNNGVPAHRVNIAKALDGIPFEKSWHNKNTYRSVRRMIELGVLRYDTELRSKAGKLESAYKLDRQQLIRIWTKTKEYQLSKNILMEPGVLTEDDDVFIEAMRRVMTKVFRWKVID